MEALLVGFLALYLIIVSISIAEDCNKICSKTLKYLRHFSINRNYRPLAIGLTLFWVLLALYFGEIITAETITEEKVKEFLLLSAKVLGTLIAIVMPLSLTIVANTLKQYKRTDIARMLVQEPSYKHLFGIIYLVLLILIFPYLNSLLKFSFFMDWVFLVLVISAFLVFIEYLKTLKRYSIEIDEIIQEKAIDSITSFFKNVNLSKIEKRNILFNSIHDLKKSCINNIENSKEIQFKRSISYLTKVTWELIESCHKNPLLLEELFREDEDEQKYHRALGYSPEVYHVVIGVYYDIWKVAFENRAWVFAEFIVDKIMNLHKKMYVFAPSSTLYIYPSANDNHHNLAIEYIHNVYQRMLLTGSELGSQLPIEDIDLNIMLKSIAYRWYFFIKESNGEQDAIRDLDFLDWKLFEGIQILIKKEKLPVFKNFIESCLQTITAFYHHSKDITRNLEKLHGTKSSYPNLINIYSKLRDDSDYLYSHENLLKWKEELDEFYILLELGDNLFIEEQIKLLNNRADYFFRKNRLHFLFIQIGAYALFKEKFHFIDEIFNYRTPKDSNIYWGNEDILPRTIKETIEIIIKFKHSRSYYYLDTHWEYRHGYEIYVDEFFILMLNRVAKQELTNTMTDLAPTEIGAATYIFEKLHERIPDSMAIKLLSKNRLSDEIKDQLSFCLKGIIEALEYKNTRNSL